MPLLPPEDLPRHVADHHGRQPSLGPRSATCRSSRATPPGSRRSGRSCEHAVRRGVPVMTLYAFSRENWARSDDEVIGLFGLLEAAIRERDRGAARAGRPGPAPRPRRRAARRDAPLDRRAPRRDGRRRPVAPQHRLQLRRPDGARRRCPAARRERRRRRRRSTRRPSAPRCTRPACPIPTCSSGPVASSGCRTSSSGSRRTRSSTSATPCGLTSGRHAFDEALARVRPPPSPFRAVGEPDASARDQRGDPRPASLLVVLAVGGLGRLAGDRRSSRSSPRGRSSRCCKAAGHPALPALGAVLALAVVLDAAFPDVLEGSGLLLIAVGVVLDRRRPRSRGPTHGTAWRRGWRRSSGRCTSACSPSSIRLGHAGAAGPAGAPLDGLGAERGWILLLVLAVWSYDTGAYLVGRAVRARRSS